MNFLNKKDLLRFAMMPSYKEKKLYFCQYNHSIYLHVLLRISVIKIEWIGWLFQRILKVQIAARLAQQLACNLWALEPLLATERSICQPRTPQICFNEETMKRSRRFLLDWNRDMHVVSYRSYFLLKQLVDINVSCTSSSEDDITAAVRRAARFVVVFIF